ncbi:SixA phosphatase family protein [Teredinibacter sp. KSP-S5-2]|uniref:SixA phosphatase family protein n=1 Tax=Teredinibacter sp. KSP-S5-2 TaxID=3034506 RepID=UPI0029346E6D|nr:histidine phosphatase family protein [Teredinibacter sp. KSP-S5-2]WNO09059.1 histidine phosphatase family protein [Teredinibacter sp. KSP-S5-2]
MKYLHLIRHAKSSWRDPGVPDVNRPLNKRGRASCALMAEKIAQSGCAFNHVYCSPAVRAQSTIERILTELAIGSDVFRIDDQLYTFDHMDLVYWLRELEDEASSIVIVGHNPAFTELHNYLAEAEIENIPTCGYVQLILDIENWRDIRANSGKQSVFIYPKMFTE